MASPERNRERLLSELAEQRPTLNLSTLDLCFTAALYLQAEGAGLTSLEEDRLIDVFEQVCATLEPSTENVRARATHAIRRLREQRLLARVDGSGVVRAGHYSLSRLGASIVEFYLEEDVLTRESLTVLLRTLTVALREVRNRAGEARTSKDWEDHVLVPLRVTVGDLAGGIERRQRGLDHQQEEFQRELGRLLEADWFGAIDRCQTLLESTAATLRELNDILLRDTQGLQELLHDIMDYALDAQQAALQPLIARVIDQVDRFTAWGAARQQAWSEYYEYVHRYLRDVVRLDPTRALSKRLRDQLVAHTGQPFSLTIASVPPLAVLREIKPTRSGAPVRRLHEERETDPAEIPPDDPLLELEQRVREEIERGCGDLASLTAVLTAGLSAQERFLVAGRIAQAVAKLSRPTANVERPWVAAGDGLCIEQWQMAAATSRE